MIRGLTLTPDELALVERLRFGDKDAADACALIEWLESEALALLRSNDRLHARIAHLEQQLAINIAVYPERFYDEMDADNWHQLMRAAGAKANRGATPEAIRSNFDYLPFQSRVDAISNYLCGVDSNGKIMKGKK